MMRNALLTLAAIMATAAVTLLAACTGGGSPSRSGSPPSARAASTSASTVAYSACMRSRGVPNFPDPDSSGHLPKTDAQHVGVSSSQLQAARQACQHLLPDTGGTNADSVDQCMTDGNCPQALVQNVLNEERTFAECMRNHGVRNWPDPSIDSQGRPVFAISISKLGFNPYSSPIWTQGNQCSHLMPELTGAPFQVSP
jgi:hypothetical protein